MSERDLQSPAPLTGKPSRFADVDLDRTVRELRAELARMGALPAAGARVITDQELADGVETPVAHGLGRPPAWVRESCVRGASATGRVEEVRSSDYNRAQYVVLKATGWGATITVDVAVF